MNTLEDKKQRASNFILDFLETLFDPNHEYPENREAAKANVCFFDYNVPGDNILSKNIVFYALQVGVENKLTLQEMSCDVNIYVNLENVDYLTLTLSHEDNFKTYSMHYSAFLATPEMYIQTLIKLIGTMMDK